MKVQLILKLTGYHLQERGAADSKQRSVFPSQCQAYNFSGRCTMNYFNLQRKLFAWSLGERCIFIATLIGKLASFVNKPRSKRRLLELSPPQRAAQQKE